MKISGQTVKGIIFDVDNTLVPHGAPQDERSLRLFSSKDISSPPAEAPVLAKPTEPKPAPEESCIFCHQCGKKLPRDSTFCSACGAKLKM